MGAYLAEILVKSVDVLDGGVVRDVARDVHQVELDLQRGVRDEPQQVGLGDDLQRHQVENE